MLFSHGDSGFSAFVNNSQNKSNNNETKIKEISGFEINVQNENPEILAKKDEVLKNFKTKILSDSGIDVLANSVERPDYYKKTKRISRREAREFNKKYKKALISNKTKTRTRTKQGNFNNRKIHSFFNKKTKNGIIENNKEKRKNKLDLNKIIKDKINQLKINLIEFRIRFKNKFNEINKNTIIKFNEYFNKTKEASLSFVRKNIINKVNRRRNLLNIIVFVPIFILLYINITIIKDIIITERSINNARNYKKQSIKLNQESAEMEKEINRLKEELKN